MAPAKSKLSISIRTARLSDTDAIVSLILTSFRSFPLFDYLYAPLHKNVNNAHDTVFYMRRRVRIGIHDPNTTIVVAEMPSEEFEAAIPSTLQVAASAAGEVNAEQMLAWSKENDLSQTYAPSGNGKAVTVVGFAIWIWRDMQAPLLNDAAPGYFASLLSYTIKSFTSWESWFYRNVYTRKDQNPARFAAYLAAEDEAEQKYYTEPCLQLDNLCADFRVQNSGIGRALLKWGIAQAKKRNLKVQTEASPQGAPFYLKFGFRIVGEWQVQSSDEAGSGDLTLEPPRLIVLKAGYADM